MTALLHFCLTIDHSMWNTGNPASRIDRTLAYARLADQAGFDSIWLNEDPDGWDAFAVLGALARETERACATTYAWLVANAVDETRRWAIRALNETAVRELAFRGTPEMFPGAGEHADR